ncbi:MAG TPA: hypothetical protein VLW50_11395 [Streptosporangiaceae bacterium]|nr:hypothetical protein [Streptosporangiaceae bacterium]
MADLRSFGSPADEADAGHRHAWAAAKGNGSGAGVILPFVKPAAAATGYEAVTRYCPMLAIDIKAFNRPERGEDVQLFLRAAMYRLLAGAFDGSCVQWSACHREDRGDGVLIVAPPGTPEAALIDPLVDHLRAGLRRHNKLCSDLATIRLRMAVHAGQVQFDQNGVSGYAVTHLFRMLEAAAFKRAFTKSDADFALVASAALYKDVISQGPGLIDPDMYAPINIRCKETRARAWLYLPPVRNPFLHSVSSSRRPAGGSADTGTGQPARARPHPAPGSCGRAGAGATAGPAPSPATVRTPSRTAIPATLPRPRAPLPAVRPAAEEVSERAPLCVDRPAKEKLSERAPLAASAVAEESVPERPGLAENPPAKESEPERAPLPGNPPAKESVSERARLIASRAVNRQGWLASVPGSASMQARFRGRLHPGQRFQHV